MDQTIIFFVYHGSRMDAGSGRLTKICMGGENQEKREEIKGLDKKVITYHLWKHRSKLYGNFKNCKSNKKLKKSLNKESTKKLI